MKRFLLVLGLSLLSVNTHGADANAQPRIGQRLPDDIGKRLADQVPRPITVPRPVPSTTTVREQVFNRFATWQGVLVAAVTLTLTLLICRPRKSKLHSGTPKTSGVPRTLVEEFRASMGMNYERWHDGISYDLYLFDKATPDERDEIETLLLNEPVTDWRIVEGLSRIRTTATIARLQSALESSQDHEVKMAITEYAADLITTEQRTSAIIAAVREASMVKGLHLALRQLTKFHPPEIIDELLRATLQREGDAATHCAAHLLVIFGKASSTFEDAHRPLLARFSTQVPEERAAAHKELLCLLKSA